MTAVLDEFATVIWLLGVVVTVHWLVGDVATVQTLDGDVTHGLVFWNTPPIGMVLELIENEPSTLPIVAVLDVIDVTHGEVP
jgi:hypothetical protein